MSGGGFRSLVGKRQTLSPTTLEEQIAVAHTAWIASGRKIIRPVSPIVRVGAGDQLELMSKPGRLGSDIMGDFYEYVTAGAFGGESRSKRPTKHGERTLYPDVIDVARKRMDETKAAGFKNDLTIKHSQLRVKHILQHDLPEWQTPYVVFRHGYRGAKSYRGSRDALIETLTRTPVYAFVFPPSLVTHWCNTEHKYLRHSRHPQFPDATVVRRHLLWQLVANPGAAMKELGLAPDAYSREIRKVRPLHVNGHRMRGFYVWRFTDADPKAWRTTLAEGAKLWFDTHYSDKKPYGKQVEEPTSAAAAIESALELPF